MRRQFFSFLTLLLSSFSISILAMETEKFSNEKIGWNEELPDTEKLSQFVDGYARKYKFVMIKNQNLSKNEILVLKFAKLFEYIYPYLQIRYPIRDVEGAAGCEIISHLEYSRAIVEKFAEGLEEVYPTVRILFSNTHLNCDKRIPAAINAFIAHKEETQSNVYDALTSFCWLEK